MEEGIAKCSTTPLVWVRRPNKKQKDEKKKAESEIKNLTQKSALKKEEMDQLRQSIANELSDQIAWDVEERLRLEF
jgi:transcriptional regulator NrdR family protein